MIRFYNRVIHGAAAVLVCLCANPCVAAEPGTTSAVIPAYAAKYPEYGVSESVRAGDFVYIGGIIAIDTDGKVIAPNDGAAQAEVVYSRIKTILAAHGATFKNVVSETIYLTDWDRLAAGASIRRRFYDEAGAAYPSAVGQEVVSLALLGLVMEVQMVVYLGEAKMLGQ